MSPQTLGCDDPSDETILYDPPLIVRENARVTGPYSMDAVPTLAVRPLDDFETSRLLPTDDPVARAVPTVQQATGATNGSRPEFAARPRSRSVGLGRHGDRIVTPVRQPQSGPASPGGLEPQFPPGGPRHGGSPVRARMTSPFAAHAGCSARSGVILTGTDTR